MRKELIVLPAEEGDLQEPTSFICMVFSGPFRGMCGKGLFTSHFTEVKRNCQVRKF